MASRKSILIPALLVLVAIGIYTQLTVFVVAPIGALPEGKTVVMLRLKQTEFIDSADGICERIQQGVSLMCRMVIMGKVIGEGKILMRAPYSATLYQISTGGKTYDR